MSACTGGVSGCHNDQKIGCETLVDKDDSPAESFFLSKAAELDWIDRNAFIDRKGTSVNLINSDFQIPNNPPSDSPSPIIAPPKPHNKASSKRRRRIRLFPKRSSGVSVVAEPSSPKVSCTGRVRSRSRRGKKKQAEPAITRSKSQKKRGFCWSSFRCIFRRQHPKGNVADPPPSLGAVKRFSSARRSDAWAAALEGDAVESERPPLGRDVLKSDPPSLGVMPRFSSARRSDAWAADLPDDDGAKS